MNNLFAQKFNYSVTLILAIFLFQSCGIKDLRTTAIKQNGIQTANIEKGKRLLDKAWKAQGMDQLSNFNTYSFNGKDTWKGMLGSMGKVWKDKKSEMAFKYRVQTFDAQVSFLDGKDKGTSSGLQDWNYYDIKNGQPFFSDKDKKENKRKVFGIAAYQFFTEMVDRLRNAPIIAYAGEKELRGQKYDLVFCTWHQPEPHMENDQYIVWINQKTGLLDFAEYTLRESYLKPPGYKKIGGGVEFTDFREIDGILVPYQQIIYAFKLRENPKKHLHKLYISDFQFDNFEESTLQVDKKIPLGTESKK